jgi:integrase
MFCCPGFPGRSIIFFAKTRGFDLQKENIFVIAKRRREQLLQTIEEVAFKENPCEEIKKEMEIIKKIPLERFLNEEEIEALLHKCFPLSLIWSF